MKKVRLLLTVLLLMMTTLVKAGHFTVGDKSFLLNGEPFVVKAAEIHYPRIPQPYWEHRIKMCKALGMNTVCIYVFWNIHEQREGQFDFTGNNDVAAFCRLAQKNGMYVIVRPGPYVCAEWEMGGLPWWLLKKKDIRLREQDPYFMERVKIFEQKVGEQLAPLTIQNGGPIIMVQVENEYGSYGENKPYVSEIRDCLRGIYGQELALFQCDWASNFEKNGLDDLVWTMNFGTGANIDQQFRRLGELRPDAPKMCSEFWSGWFDKWGAQHETRPAKDMVDGMDEMLSKGISFSLYMTHGGTSFGHWAGANSPGFAPDVTSYDYDAPINEQGLPTSKFWELRTMMQKYSLSPAPSPKGKGNKVALPAVPKAPMPIIEVPQFRLEKVMDLCGLVTKRVENRDVLTMEDMDCGWGMIQYTTTDCHDYAQIWVNHQFVGSIDRVKNEKSLMLPPVKKGDVLNILVEAMGRINFGRAIKDFKGITSDVQLQTEQDGHEMTYTLKHWVIRTMADDYEAIKTAMASNRVEAKDNEAIVSDGGYFKGEFTLKKVGDTFLNFEAFGKGQVWVNGHAMGRIWHIGPQQTLYVPGCWLKKGKNEVIVLDIVGPKAEPIVFGQTEPELNKLNLEKSATHNQPGDKPDLNSATPVAEGQLMAGNGWQTVKFNAPHKGRYVALVARSTQKGDDEVSVAEVYVQDAQGRRLSRESWTVKYSDSEDVLRGNNTADKTFDLQESTYWRTVRKAKLPHMMVIDLGSEQTVAAFEYLPRAEQGAPGSIKDYQIFVY